MQVPISGMGAGRDPHAVSCGDRVDALDHLGDACAWDCGVFEDRQRRQPRKRREDRAARSQRCRRSLRSGGNLDAGEIHTQVPVYRK
jgi:hypothetical protein